MTKVKFASIEPQHLKPVAAIAQALDTFWVPRFLLPTVLPMGWRQKKFAYAFEQIARTEYRRALITTEQIVVSLPDIYTNPILFEAFLASREEPELNMHRQTRNAFKALLRSGAIVPYFLTEHTPVQHPLVDSEAFEAWEQFCQEDVYMQCLRLSWDNHINQQMIQQQVQRPFHDFAEDAWTDKIDLYIQQLGLKLDDRKHFQKRLLDLQYTCLELRKQGTSATRDMLYQAFVSAKTPLTMKQYGKKRPFAAAIKQMIDLAQISYMQDTFGIYALHPPDSLPRSALQELPIVLEPMTEITLSTIWSLLENLRLPLRTMGRYLKSFGLLRLEEIYAIRGLHEWLLYIQSLENLRNCSLHTISTEGQVEQVYFTYVQLVQKVTELVAKREQIQDYYAQWHPVLELCIEVSDARLSALWSPEGIFSQVDGAISPLVAQRSAPAAAYLIIHNWSSTSTQADLDLSFEFMRGVMHDAKYQWQELIGKVKQISIPQEFSMAWRTQAATITAPRKYKSGGPSGSNQTC